MAATQNGFPALKPALITKVHIDPTKIRPFGISSLMLHTILGEGQSLTSGQESATMDPASRTLDEVPSGTIETVPGFEPAFKATVVFGADWFSTDADGKHGRVDFKGIATTEDGHVIDVRTKGIIDMTAPAAAKVFTLQPDMASVPFGHAAANVEYLASDPKLKFLEYSYFVGSAQIIIDEQGVTLGNRQSIVLTPPVVSE